MIICLYNKERDIFFGKKKKRKKEECKKIIQFQAF
jgi:hypothetical protein